MRREREGETRVKNESPAGWKRAVPDNSAALTTKLSDCKCYPEF